MSSLKSFLNRRSKNLKKQNEREPSEDLTDQEFWDTFYLIRERIQQNPNNVEETLLEIFSNLSIKKSEQFQERYEKLNT